MRETGSFKSTFSKSGGGACVEAGFVGDGSRLRDSKNPGAVLVGDVSAMVTAAKVGLLDR